MEELYKIFLRHLRADQPTSGFNHLPDYMSWLKDHFLMVGDMESYRVSYPFKFDAHNKSTVIGDVISQIRQYSTARLSTNTDIDRIFDTRCHDLVSEYEYHASLDTSGGIDEINWRWLDENKHELGICRKYSRNDYADVLGVFFINYYYETSQEFEEKLLRSESLNNITYVDIKDGHAVFDFDAFQYYIEEHLIKEILLDLDNIVEELSVLYCSGSLYDSVDGDHNGYFVLCGYNPSHGYGEGWIIDSYAPY